MIVEQVYAELALELHDEACYARDHGFIATADELEEDCRIVLNARNAEMTDPEPRPDLFYWHHCSECARYYLRPKALS